MVNEDWKKKKYYALFIEEYLERVTCPIENRYSNSYL